MDAAVRFEPFLPIISKPRLARGFYLEGQQSPVTMVPVPVMPVMMAPSPVTMMPVVVMPAMVPMMAPAHLQRLDAIDFVLRDNGGLHVSACGNLDGLLRRHRWQRRSLRA
jgi:hypothetical protein